MSTELLEPEGVQAARTALDEFRATQEESTEFFGEVFDQLQALSLELFARHKCLEMTIEQKPPASPDDDSLSDCRGEFRRAIEHLQRHSSDLEAQLARLTAVATKIVEAASHQPPTGQIVAILESTRQQHADWLQQRAALEAELEALRGRAAQQAETLYEQKRLAGQQQAELAGELRRMRSLLEALASQVRGDAAICDLRLLPVDSAALGSVLAQFDLQACGADAAHREHPHDPDGTSGV